MSRGPPAFLSRRWTGSEAHWTRSMSEFDEERDPPGPYPADRVSREKVPSTPFTLSSGCSEEGPVFRGIPEISGHHRTSSRSPSNAILRPTHGPTTPYLLPSKRLLWRA